MPQLNTYVIGPDPGYLVVVLTPPFVQTTQALRDADLPQRERGLGGVIFDLRLSDGIPDALSAELANVCRVAGPQTVALAGPAAITSAAVPPDLPVERATTLDEAMSRLASHGSAPLLPRVVEQIVAPDGATRVLLCDDDSGMRDLVRAQLEIEGMQIVGECTNGREAIERAHELAPDVILLDVYMPVLSGIDALPQLREASPSSKVLILTASDDDELRASALASGAHMYLRKSHPFEIPRMVRLVLDPAVAQPDVVVARWE